MSSNTTYFFENGTLKQFEYVIGLYDRCLRVKAESRSSKPDNVIKLDKWYQNDLPKKIKSRGKEAHLIHDEIVQTIKWKLARGKFRPNLTNLIQMNTPRVVMQETKKAFRKLAKTKDIEAATLVLCNLKGVGPAMASAVLAAGAPEIAPFMADECLLSMPDVDSLDYTMKEYMRYVVHVRKCIDRLKQQGGDWSAHRVELAVWAHYIAFNLSPELLEGMPDAKSDCSVTNGDNIAPSVEENGNSCSSLAATTSEDSNLSSTAGEQSEVEINNKTPQANEVSENGIGSNSSLQVKEDVTSMTNLSVEKCNFECETASTIESSTASTSECQTASSSENPTVSTSECLKTECETVSTDESATTLTTECESTSVIVVQCAKDIIKENNDTEPSPIITAAKSDDMSIDTSVIEPSSAAENDHDSSPKRLPKDNSNSCSQESSNNASSVDLNVVSTSDVEAAAVADEPAAKKTKLEDVNPSRF